MVKRSIRFLCSAYYLGACTLVLCGAASGAPWPSQSPTPRPAAVCTGLGLGPRGDRKPVEFYAAPGYDRLLGEETLTISTRNGTDFLAVQCDARRILVDLAPGQYTATMREPDFRTSRVAFSVRPAASGAIVRFAERDQDARVSELG